MIRTLNFAFIVITGLVCLGLYRIAEEARIAQVDLRETRAAIVREQDALAVLGAEWARITQPARIQALTQRHLDLSDKPAVLFSSLNQLPQKIPPLVPESGFANAKAVAPVDQPNAPPISTASPKVVPAGGLEQSFAQRNAGT